jgi:hypothetical protein
MKQQSKLNLSDEELQLANNTGWILTKHDIVRKVYELFGELAQQYKATLDEEFMFAGLVAQDPKISKGENYLQLPYVMLDYPREFNHQDVFAVRTMFWWGNFFSITVHLSGSYKKEFEEKLLQGFTLLQQQGFYACVNEDPWQHHFEETNYYPVNRLTETEFEKLVTQKNFLKLAAKIPVTVGDEVPVMLATNFKLLMKLLTNQLPNR